MARGKTVGRYRPTRKGKTGGDQSNRWLGTYGDAVTLLMAFFVMLYAMSQIDAEKFEAFVSGLEAPFGNPSAREGLLDSASGLVADAAVDVGPAQVSVAPDRPVVHATPEPTAEPSPVPTPEPVEEQPAVNAPVPPTVDVAQLERIRAEIQASLDRAALGQVADFRIDERGLVVSIAADDILFETGSTRISGLGRRIIAAVAGPLRNFGNDVIVEGHTDNVPLRRPGYTNWNLSTDRAVAVLSLLFNDFGLSQPRLGAAGYGEFRPRVPNDSPQNRSLNRRVDILVVAQGV